MTYFYDYSQRKKYKVNVVKDADKYKIYFKNVGNSFQYFLQQVKGMTNAKWTGSYWQVSAESLRNQNILGHLTNGEIGTVNPFKRYTQPIIPFNPKRDLREHQKDLLNFANTRKRCIIAAEMGLGKTLTAIELIEKIKDEQQINNDYEDIWIIAPKAALRSWVYEFKKWNVNFQPQLITCSYQSIEKAIRRARKPPRILIVDESSKFKSGKAKRTKYLMQLSEMLHNEYHGNEYIILMSGAPAPKDPSDWWAQCEIAQPGYLKEKSQAQLLQSVAFMDTCEGPYGTYTKVNGWNTEAIEKLYQRLKPLVIVKRAKDCINLPEISYNRLECEVTEKTLAHARLIIESSERAVTALIKLRQLSDGFQLISNDEEDKEFKTTRIVRVNTVKEEMLKDFLETLQDNEINRFVIYAGFTASVDLCVNLCQKLNINVIRVDGRGWKSYGPIEASQEQFQDRDLDKPIAFVGNPDSGGMGLTLTAAKHMIFYSNSFNNESRMQSVKRIHRIGSTGANIYDLIHLPTDDKILEALEFKKNIQDITLGELLSPYLKATM